MLETVELKEEYIVEDGICYAVQKTLGTKRKVDGCEVRSELLEEYAAAQTELANLEAQLIALKKEMAENKTLDAQLAVAGYCLISTPVYKKIDGIVVKDSDGNPVVQSYSHSAECTHKGG